MEKFKQGVSMRCTKEQFERDLKQPLTELGYEISTFGHLWDGQCRRK